MSAYDGILSAGEMGNLAMRSPLLEPEVKVDVLLSAMCGRNQYTRDPAPVIDELIAAAGG